MGAGVPQLRRQAQRTDQVSDVRLPQSINRSARSLPPAVDVGSLSPLAAQLATAVRTAPGTTVMVRVSPPEPEPRCAPSRSPREKPGSPDFVRPRSRVEGMFKLEYRGARMSLGYSACPEMEDRHKVVNRDSRRPPA
ncbi:hypothetical protein GCM10023198_27620 [Promicromonospora umidemergens]|uniref:Uncharacterized protein n=1 Tax=Promicromonospora umidemergens TaxID=629679 RepID=A0ABP8XAW1_9MICO